MCPVFPRCELYIGSTSSFVLNREHSRYRKFLQVQQTKFVLAEVALRFWSRYDNFWIWSILPIYTGKSNFWALEQALLQLSQPHLITPFIYQFFNCRKGIIKRAHFSTSEKKIRYNAVGPQGCYFLRRLANNLREPQCSYALNAIDRAIKFWKAKPVRRPVPLRAPWLLSPAWRSGLKHLLTAHVHKMKPHNVSLQFPLASSSPSTCP